MPLQVARLRDSDLAAEESPEACWYAVLLWAASWHQLPAGSLPDNETVLMKLCGLGRDQRTFRKHRAGALRGFVKCSDGRLYHPVVAEQAIAAWEGKLEQRWRSECARIKKHNQRHGTSIDPPSLDEFKARDCQPVPLDKLDPSRGTGGTRPEGQQSLSPGTRGGCPSGNTLQEKGKGTGTGTDSPKSPNRSNRHDPGDGLPDEVRQVMEAGGFVSPPPDLGLLREWRAAGATLEGDILPTLRAVAGSVRDRGGRTPFKLKLYDQAIRDRLAADRAESERLRRIAQRYDPPSEAAH